MSYKTIKKQIVFILAVNLMLISSAFAESCLESITNMTNKERIARYAIDPCPNCVTFEEEIIHKNCNIQRIKPAHELSTGWDNVHNEGDSKVYDGPIQGSPLIFGPYRTAGKPKGTTVLVSIDMEAQTWGSTYRTCNHRHWLTRKCDGWDTHYRNSGFTLDVTTNSGQKQHIVHEFTYANIPRAEYYVGSFKIDGVANAVEVRLGGFHGERAKVKVHAVKIHFAWE